MSGTISIMFRFVIKLHAVYSLTVMEQTNKLMRAAAEGAVAMRLAS